VLKEQVVQDKESEQTRVEEFLTPFRCRFFLPGQAAVRARARARRLYSRFRSR
jgi:hypothetical protein